MNCAGSSSWTYVLVNREMQEKKLPLTYFSFMRQSHFTRIKMEIKFMHTGAICHSLQIVSYLQKTVVLYVTSEQNCLEQFKLSLKYIHTPLESKAHKVNIPVGQLVLIYYLRFRVSQTALRHYWCSSKRPLHIYHIHA